MRNYVAAGILAVFVLALGVLYLVGRGMSGRAPAKGTASEATTTSLGELLRGAPVVCTFATTTLNVSESGTIYVAQGKIAGDIIVQSPMGPVEGHMVVQDGSNYVWSSLSPTEGFKMSAASSTGAGAGFDYDTRMAFNCAAWTPDETMFALPPGIEFKEVSQSTTTAKRSGNIH